MARTKMDQYKDTNRQSRKNQQSFESLAKTLAKKSNRNVAGAAELRKKAVKNINQEIQKRGDSRAAMQKTLRARAKARKS